MAAAGCADPAATPDAGPPQPDWGPYPPTWKAVPADKVDLHGAACFQGHLFAVGAQGAILHRAPGAGSFTRQAAPFKARFTRIAFASDGLQGSMGVAVGEHHGMIQSKDLGKKWSIASQCNKEPVDSFGGLHLETAANGFVMGLRKSDGATVPKFSSGGA